MSFDYLARKYCGLASKIDSKCYCFSGDIPTELVFRHGPLYSNDNKNSYSIDCIGKNTEEEFVPRLGKAAWEKLKKCSNIYSKKDETIIINKKGSCPDAEPDYLLPIGTWKCDDDTPVCPKGYACDENERKSCDKNKIDWVIIGIIAGISILCILGILVAYVIVKHFGNKPHHEIEAQPVINVTLEQITKDIYFYFEQLIRRDNPNYRTSQVSNSMLQYIGDTLGIANDIIGQQTLKYEIFTLPYYNDSILLQILIILKIILFTKSKIYFNYLSLCDHINMINDVIIEKKEEKKEEEKEHVIDVENDALLNMLYCSYSIFTHIKNIYTYTKDVAEKKYNESYINAVTRYMTDINKKIENRMGENIINITNNIYYNVDLNIDLNKIVILWNETKSCINTNNVSPKYPSLNYKVDRNASLL